MIRLEKTAQVWCICGNLGGGKTLTAVSMAYHAMLEGYFVCTNVTLNMDEICKTIPYARQLYMHIVVRKEEWDEQGNLISSEDFNPFTIPSGTPRGHEGGKRVMVILDECAEWFDQYSNLKSKSLTRVMSWLRHSSKRSQDVVFIVQRRDYLNKNFRILVSRWINVEDLAVWRLPLLHIKVPFMGGFVMAQPFDKAGTMTQNLKFIRKSLYGKFYDTAECLSTFGGKSLEYTVTRKVANYDGLIILIYIISLICICVI